MIHKKFGSPEIASTIVIVLMLAIIVTPLVVSASLPEGGKLKLEGEAEPLNSADIVNTRLAGYDLAGKMSALTTLSGIEPSQLTEIEQFAAKMKLTPDGIQIKDMQMIMPALGALLKPSGMIAVGLNKLKGKNAVDIPFFIRGLASDPQFIPDTSKAADGILGSLLSGQEGKDDQSGNGGTLGDALRGLFNRK
jgi:hypothetical protein